MSDWLSISGQHALVTGGAKRLGAAVALRLAEAGMDVTVHYRTSEEEALRLAARIRERGRSAWTIRGDLADPQVAGTLVQRVVDQARGVDVLVNSASLFEEARLVDVTPENLWRNIRTNALGPFLLSRAMQGQGRPGAIVNLLDTMIADYDDAHVPYHVSKRMLGDLTAMMAVEFSPEVRVNAVAPGLVLPPAGQEEDYLVARHNTNYLRRHGSAEGIAEAVLFLIRSGFVTGQTVYVDGGRHLRGRMYG